MQNRTIFTLAITTLSLFISQNVWSDCQIINNVKGYTATMGTKQLTQFGWLAFENGKVLAVGDNNANLPDCELIDGKGRYLLPGLTDAHAHVSGLGNEMLQVVLRDVKSESLAVKLVQKFAKENQKLQWILGRGWNQVLWLDKKFPGKKSLDDSGIKRPILLERIDGHAAWVNSRALELAGINKSTPDPQGGRIERDAEGNATGLLIDEAIDIVEEKIPPATLLERDFAFDKAFAHLLSLGVTSVHDAGVVQLDLDVYQNRVKQSKMPLRVYGMLDALDENLDRWLEQGFITDKNEMLSIRSVKIYADGALGSRGAALLAPYSDDVDNKGLLIVKPKKLESTIENVLAHGFQANTHAIGDRGNRLVLDSLEKAFKKVGGKNLRNRLEHSQIISLEDIPRFKTLGVIASIQPIFATSDMNMAGERLGDERLKGSYAWNKFLKQGTVIASGSDFPVELANPFYGLHAAVTRQDRNNQPEGGWLPGEKISATEALRSFTLSAAYAAHQENTLGSLEKGKWADFILVDRDIIKGDPKDIWKTNVLQTWIAGELRFEK